MAGSVRVKIGCVYRCGKYVFYKRRGDALWLDLCGAKITFKISAGPLIEGYSPVPEWEEV